VSGLSDHALKEATDIFNHIAPKVIRTSVEEAELAKLFANTWRYIQFAVSNEFHMICKRNGIEFDRVRTVLTDGYGRAASLPSAGFAAGPCLLKDTLQLVAFHTNQFLLGQAAMMVNEGLPNFIVEDLRKRRDLKGATVGILGMSFKADIDDIRDSLSYKLRKVLLFHGARVLCTDPYVRDPEFANIDRVFAESDVVIIGVPHTAYRTIRVPARIELVDLWGVVGRKTQT